MSVYIVQYGAGTGLVHASIYDSDEETHAIEAYDQLIGGYVKPDKNKGLFLFKIEGADFDELDSADDEVAKDKLFEFIRSNYGGNPTVIVKSYVSSISDWSESSLDDGGVVQQESSELVHN